ncbi:hypothetical protein NE237_009445 [Protea cynaroides]|uniref:Uncharacterized protein n=1 Tax=Protea cynaroides TaxID=273540 RepID=A0A9Q0KXU5_9MAGN|nr:hypothetical protein NE237_009445 [Protea cynaroides]
MLIPLPHASDVASSLSNRFISPCRYSYLVDPLSPPSTRQSSSKNCTRPFICHSLLPRTIMVLGTRSFGFIKCLSPLSPPPYFHQWRSFLSFLPLSIKSPIRSSPSWVEGLFFFFNACLMWEWEPCTGWSLGRGGQPHRKIHYVFRHYWEGVLAVTETTAVLIWKGRFFRALIRKNHIVCNGLDFYGTTCGQSHSHESEWVRANPRKGGDGDVFFQSGWTDLLKGLPLNKGDILPLNKGDILTFQYEGDVILVVTTPHSMTGYEKVGSYGFLAV